MVRHVYLLRAYCNKVTATMPKCSRVDAYDMARDTANRRMPGVKHRAANAHANLDKWCAKKQQEADR